jgi:uncharacterized protein DUF3311
MEDCSRISIYNQPNMAASASKSRRAHWYWLLLLPALALMFPAMYARSTPELFGFPFFYWYQLAWIILTSLLSWIVYRATEKRS